MTNTLIILLLLVCLAIADSCKDPVTVVYILADGIDPKQYAQEHGMGYLKRLSKVKHMHEFQIACADGYSGGHQALITSIKQQQQQQQEGQRRKKSEPGVIVADFGIQEKRVLHPRSWVNDQWHLTADHSSANTHVSDVWTGGITGNGIVISVVDDGLAWNNIDLRERFSLTHSANYNSGSQRNDPYPSSIRSAHGTAAAGVAAASGTSGPPFDHSPGCAFGVAPMATLAGVRLISEPVSDATEAAALSHDCESVSVYSCSWGPSDDGERVEGPGPLAKSLVSECATETGRDGKGSIYVWAAGNGRGRYDDSCAYDGYVSLPDVIAVAALARDGLLADYSEDCTAVFVSAPSSGHGSAITTTDVPYPSRVTNPACRADFGGTSAAAPFVAGVVALILEANPLLTNSDVQWIIASTATQVNPTDSSWTRNGAGFSYSPKYGFGLINALEAVEYARNFSNSRRTSLLFEVQSNAALPLPIVSYRIAVPDNFIVQRAILTISVAYESRADLSFTLTSPSGTISKVRGRQYDTYPNLDKWSFMFLTMWGESSIGTWTFAIQKSNTQRSGTLNNWNLKLLGNQ